MVIFHSSLFLLIRLMGQYYFAGWRLSSYVVVVCNAVGGQAGWPPGAWTVGALAAGPRGQSSGRHCTAGQYGYVPLGRQGGFHEI